MITKKFRNTWEVKKFLKEKLGEQSKNFRVKLYSTLGIFDVYPKKAIGTITTGKGTKFIFNTELTKEEKEAVKLIENYKFLLED